MSNIDISKYMIDLSKEPVQVWSKDWIVEKDGTMVSVHVENYEIIPKRLTEKDLILHMSVKGWVNMNTFIPAYFHALKLAGKHDISIQIHYPEDN